jgi:hypothetical protein
LEVLLLIGFVVVGLVVWAFFSANYSLSVNSDMTPEEAQTAVRSCFVDRANRIEENGNEIRFTPRFKRVAPTLKVRIAGDGAGCRVEMAAEYWKESRGLIPPIPAHGTWIFRKQRKIARRLVSASPTAATDSTE